MDNKKPKTTGDEEIKLSDFEVHLVLLVRRLQPYEKIEIKLNEHKTNEIAVVRSSTIKEVHLTKTGFRVL